MRMADHLADPMANAKTARRPTWSLLAIGALFAGGGFYFVLVGLSLLPGPSKQHGPNWIVLAIGLVFFAAGMSVLVRGLLGVPDNQPDLPADAPAAFKVIQWLAMFTIIAGLASVGTWIAFGSGPRAFSMSLPISGSLGENIGRTVFGIGAVITWLMAALVAYAGVMKMLGKKP
jgi:hypothetical protein